MVEDAPRDPAVERASLAGLYRFGWDAYAEVDGILVEEAYSDGFHRTLFRVLKTIFEKRPDAKIDPQIIENCAKYLKVWPEFQQKDNEKLFAGITRLAVERGNVRTFAEQVRKLHVVRGMRRRLLDAASDFEQFTGSESLNEIVTRAEEAVFDYERELAGESDDAELFGQTAVETVDHWADHPVDQVGFRVGFPLWEEAIGGGPRPGGVDVIGARSGEGKSQTCDQMALNIASQDIPCLVVDTETENKDRLGRMIGRMADLKYAKVETGRYYDGAERERAAGAAKKLAGLPIWYKSVVGRQPEDILSVIRRWVVKRVGLDPQTRKAKPCVVLFDYLKFSDQSQLKNIQEYQAIGFLMTKLHAFMARFGVACVAFVQLNRTGITVEDASAVSQGDRIIWLCTSFSIFKKKAEEDLGMEFAKPKGQPRYTHRLIPAIKSRYGGGVPPGAWIHVEADLSKGVVREGPLSTLLDEANPSRDQTPQGHKAEAQQIEFR